MTDFPSRPQHRLRHPSALALVATSIVIIAMLVAGVAAASPPWTTLEPAEASERPRGRGPDRVASATSTTASSTTTTTTPFSRVEVDVVDSTIDAPELEPGGPRRCRGYGVAPKPDGDVLRVATVNTDGGEARLRASEAPAQARRQHLRSLSRLIACLKADVVVLSEVHRETRHWPNVDMLVGIRDRLGPEWNAVFQRQCRIPGSGPGQRSEVGVAILSNDQSDGAGRSSGFAQLGTKGVRSLGVPLPVELPRRDSRYKGGWENTSNRCFWSDSTTERHRGRQRASVIAVTHGIQVVAVHLSPGTANGDLRRRQLAHLRSELSRLEPVLDGAVGRHDGPMVVAGDFNDADCVFDGDCESPWKRSFLDFFGSGWIDATGLIPTSTQRGGKIDHAFVRELVPVSADDQGRVARGVAGDFLNHHVLYVDVLAPG